MGQSMSLIAIELKKKFRLRFQKAERKLNTGGEALSAVVTENAREDKTLAKPR